MAGSRLRISNEVQRLLEEIELESLGPKLEALGVRGLHDLALVDDADLVRWGLTTIERRRFFGRIRKAAGDGSSDVLMPPSALTTTPIPGQSKAGAQRSRRPEIASVGPARLDELVGRGSAEYQVPRLAERLLAATGPLDITELASRAARAAPALAQGYEANEWPQFVEACVRSYGRLMVEDGVLQGDRAIVSICSTVLFSASEEVVADTASWVKVVTCLATPAQVAVVACLCRSSREVADGSEVWSKLLARWYPKATLLNPDWVCQTELEKRLEQALENDYALAALTKRLEPDQPMDIGDMLRALPQQTTPKALVKFMSSHPEHFKQSPDGKEFCVSRTPGDLQNCKDWRTVNPFQMPPLPKKLGGDAPASGGVGGSSSAPAPAPLGRPKELRKQQAETAPGSASGEPNEQPREVCQQLDPKVAFRLYHTGLLSQTSQQSKRGKLEAWEYYTESNSKCTMAAGDLLDLAESRVRAVRSNDPAVVHELVSQTIEGMVFKVPFGFWHRRVRVLTMALSASQLRIGREQRKKCERKLLEFMEWVKKERGFGYYQCDVCGSRWKSGFSYEEITQQCLQCGAWQRPYRIQDLESAQEREARERGEVLDPRLIAQKTSINTTVQPAINFEAPVLEHTRESARGTKRPAMRTDAGAGWAIRETPPQRPRLVQPPQWHGSGRSTLPASHQEAERYPARRREASRSPLRPTAASEVISPSPFPFWQAPPPAGREAPEDTMQAQLRAALGLADEDMSTTSVSSTAPAASNQPNTSVAGATSATEPGSRYTPGSGGFFANRRSNSSGSTGAPAANAETTNAAAQSSSTPASVETSQPAPSRYTPGSGGFFANRRSNSSASTSVPAASEEATNAATQNSTPASGETASTSSRYTPGSGGFFANRQANSSGSTSVPAASEQTTNAATQNSSTPASGDTLLTSSRYTPGSGGFFANRQANSSGSTTVPAASEEATDATTQNSSTPASAETTTRYTPGSGGFFANRQANSSGSTSAPQGNNDDVQSRTPVSIETLPSTSAPARYTPGGGGFFASRRTSSATSSNGASTEAAAPASSAPSAKAESGDSSMQSLAASLGLSVEEALAMGLLGDTAEVAKTESGASEEVARKNAEEERLKIEAATKAKKEVEAAEKKKAEEEERLKLEAATKAKEEARLRAEEAAAAEKKAEEERLKIEAATKAKEEARLRAEEAAAEEERLKMEAATKAKEEARLRAEAAAAAEKKEEEEQQTIEAAKKAEEEARLKAEAATKTKSEEPVAVSKPNIPADKLLALQTLGLTLEEAISMGILSADVVKTSEDSESATDGQKKIAVASPEPPVKKVRNEQTQQELERRREAAERFAARREGLESSAEPTAVGMDTDEAEKDAEVGEANAEHLDGAICECSDDLLVEAVNAVVTFRDAAGDIRIIAPQPSDVAYLASDSVFWPLLRRLAAEISCLEKGSGELDEDTWSNAPASSEDARQYATTRGYLLPEDMTGTSWRRFIISEAAADLMLTRLRVGRGVDLPALAGPSKSHDCAWEERPADSLEGLSSKVDAESGERLASKLLAELETVVLPSSRSEGTSCTAVDRLATVGATIAQDVSRWNAIHGPDGPVLHGNWSLLQMMGVREAAVALRGEYSVRRQILLRRLDITVQSMSASDRAVVPASQRRFEDILSRMWAGWRRFALEAPPLFEWSALAASRSMLVKATTARVSGPHARVSSKVKSFKIGAVPDRGGLPEGYAARKSSVTTQATAQEPSESSQPRPNIVTVSGGTSSTASSSSGMEQARTDTPAGGIDSKPIARVAGARPNRKQTVVGARSTNLELQKEHKAQQRKEREEGRNPNTYYEELGGIGARLPSDAS